MPIVLAGDIGGTNCRLLLVEFKDGKEREIAKKTYANAEFDSIVEQIKMFLKEYHQAAPSVACLAVAGPVNPRNTCLLTNASWKIEKIVDGTQIQDEVKITRVVLINDFVANGYGLPHLNLDADVITLQKAPDELMFKREGVKPPIICLGAGTGLGFVVVTWTGDHYEAYETEGGHTEFAPVDSQQERLHTWLRRKLGKRVSVERVVCGTGIKNIYDFLAEEDPQKVSTEVVDAMKKGDHIKIISKFGLEETDALCTETLDLFFKIYGSVAGDKALNLIPYGGLYIAGGIAPKNLKALLRRDNFTKAFFNKGRVANVLKRFPIYVVLEKDPNDDSSNGADLGLLGAKGHALDELLALSRPTSPNPSAH